MDSDRDNLRRIVDISRRINILCSDHPSIPISESSHHRVYANTHISPLVLPLPMDIIHTLINTGCSLSLSKSLSDTYIQSAHKIRTMYQSIHHRQVERLASDPDTLTSIKALGHAVERQYNEQLRSVELLAVERGRSLQLTTRHGAAPTNAKPSFNQDFVPFLEKYFEYNAYPSAPDRASLARKSMMTPRQIEVWFQNHRNRAKKEGKTLRRLTSDPLPLKLSLESLEETMPCFLIPEKDRRDPFQANALEQSSSDDSDSGDEVPSICQIDSTFSSTSPPHAFPTTYPPVTNYEPFPKQYRFSSSGWMRHVTTTAVQPHPIVDIEELITEFSTKLSIRDPSPKSHERASPLPGATAKRPWYAATHTTLPSAPHPAFIRSSGRSNQISLLTIPPIATPLSQRYPTRSSIPSSHYTIIAPSSNDVTTFRKVARLPKRTPQHLSTTNHRASPAVSEGSPSSFRSLTPSSRTSSFGSDGTFLHRPSSPSNSSSTASSTLTTPIFSPTSLPETAPSPIFIPSLDFQNIHGLFGDSDDLSPLDGSNSDFPSHISFDISVPSKDNFSLELGPQNPLQIISSP